MSSISLTSLTSLTDNETKRAPIGNTPFTVCGPICGKYISSVDDFFLMDTAIDPIDPIDPPEFPSPTPPLPYDFTPKDDFSSLCELVVPKKVRKDRQVDAILLLKDPLINFKKLSYIENNNNNPQTNNPGSDELVLSFLSVHSTNKNLFVSGVIKVENVIPNEPKYFEIRRNNDIAQVEIPIRILKSPKNVGGKGELLQLTAELCGNWIGRPFRASVRTDLRYENYRRTNGTAKSPNVIVPSNISVTTLNLSNPMDQDINRDTNSVKRSLKRQRTNSGYSDTKDILSSYTTTNASGPTVVFGVKRGRCSNGCDCDQFRNADIGNPGGKCHNCGHYPSEHENLGVSSFPASSPSLSSAITGSNISKANPYLEDFASNLVRYVASLDSVNAMLNILDHVDIPMFLKKCGKEDCRFVYLKGNQTFLDMIGLPKIEGYAVEEIENMSSSKKFVQSDLMASSTPGDLIRHIVNVRDRSTITFKLFQRGCSMILVGASLPVERED